MSPLFIRAFGVARALLSVGHWLDEVRDILARLDGRRAIILGRNGVVFLTL